MKNLVTLLMAHALWIAPIMAGEERIARLPELSASDLQLMMSGKLPGVTIEFRRGDKLPVRLDVHGDFLESDGSTATVLFVKTTFYVKVKKSRFYMSLDGHGFEPIKSVVEGELRIGVSGSSPASEVLLMLEAFLREKR